MAPEMMKGNKYDEKVDIFSFGIILCEVRNCGWSLLIAGRESLVTAKLLYVFMNYCILGLC
jgi:serine/threonine protein kinase